MPSSHSNSSPTDAPTPDTEVPHAVSSNAQPSPAERDTAHAKADAPSPNDPRKPKEPTEMHAASWKFTAKNAWREFSKDQCTDLAAALTYYSVMALFPGLLAIVSLLGVFGNSKTTIATMLDMIKKIAPSSTTSQLQPIIENMVNGRGAGLALAIGIIGALWSASGYVGAFSRAMNRVYQVDEGRPMITMRLMQLGITVVIVLMAVIGLVAMTMTGSIAQTVGDKIGLGSTALSVWSVLKWPLLLVVVVTMVALLYYFTPNIKQPKFRWVSIGALVAIVVWIVISLAFGFYVSNFGKYDKTYGALAGVIVMLLWLWLTNLALLFGAEIDSELERARQLQAGMPAEKTLQLPPKETKASDKNAVKQQKAVDEARAIRIGAAQASTRSVGRADPAKVALDDDGFVDTDAEAAKKRGKEK